MSGIKEVKTGDDGGGQIQAWDWKFKSTRLEYFIDQYLKKKKRERDHVILCFIKWDAMHLRKMLNHIFEVQKLLTSIKRFVPILHDELLAIIIHLMER